MFITIIKAHDSLIMYSIYIVILDDKSIEHINDDLLNMYPN